MSATLVTRPVKNLGTTILNDVPAHSDICPELGIVFVDKFFLISLSGYDVNLCDNDKSRIYIGIIID